MGRPISLFSYPRNGASLIIFITNYVVINIIRQVTVAPQLTSDPNEKEELMLRLIILQDGRTHLWNTEYLEPCPNTPGGEPGPYHRRKRTKQDIALKTGHHPGETSSPLDLRDCNAGEDDKSDIYLSSRFRRVASKTQSRSYGRMAPAVSSSAVEATCRANDLWNKKKMAGRAEISTLTEVYQAFPS